MRNKGKSHIWWVRGSYTVEAAFIVPIVLGILFAIMYVVFFEHDKLVLQSNVRDGILLSVSDGGELPEPPQWKKQVQSRLWLGKVSESGIRRSGLVVKGSATIQFHLQIPVLMWFLEEKQEIRCEEKWEIWKPAQAIRLKGGVDGGGV